MRHLVATLADVPLAVAHARLAEAHDFLVDRCRVALASIPDANPLWGIQVKRMYVGLAVPGRPDTVGKDAERVGEVVNMVATIERLIAALNWFARNPEFGELRVTQCHPSTSSLKGSNDLVLEDGAGRIIVRCEVCDVVSASAGQNGKERKDLASLGCAEGVPADGVRRFLCASAEFARAIQSEKRKWTRRQHRYRAYAAGDTGETVMVELVPPPVPSLR